MSTFLKITGAVLIAISCHLVASTAAVASEQSSASDGFWGADHPMQSFIPSETASKANRSQIKGETYQPPDDIGGPSDTQGSGTR